MRLTVTVNMAYDALDRLLTRAFPADATQNATYAYDTSADASGFPRRAAWVTRADATGLTAFGYDERGQRAERHVHRRARRRESSPTAYAYDKASRVSGLTYPSGLTVGYSRDAQGNVSGVAVTPPRRDRRHDDGDAANAALRPGLSRRRSATASRNRVPTILTTG